MFYSSVFRSQFSTKMPYLRVCKKKKPLFVWGWDRKTRPSRSPGDLSSVGKQHDANRWTSFFSIPPSHSWWAHPVPTMPNCAKDKNEQPHAGRTLIGDVIVMLKWRHHATHNYYVASQRIQDFLEAFFTFFPNKNEVFKWWARKIIHLCQDKENPSLPRDHHKIEPQQCGNLMCDQQRLRPACAYAQSDQSYCLSLEYSMTLRLLIEHYLEFLS